MGARILRQLTPAQISAVVELLANPGGGGPLGDGSVTNAKLAAMATARIKGRATAGSGAPEDLTIAQLKTLLALIKADVGLGNVDNTADADKPISTATQTALNGLDAALDALVEEVGGLAAEADLGMLPINRYTASHELALADFATQVDIDAATACVVTLPADATVALPVGTAIPICRAGTGAVTIQAGAGATVAHPASRVLSITEQYESAIAHKVAANAWRVGGALEAAE